MKNILNTMKTWAKNHVKTVIATSVALVAVIVLSVAWATGACSHKVANTAAADSKTAVTSEVPASTDKTPININITADDKVTADSTPVIVHVQNDDKTVDFYHAVDSGKKTATVYVSPGKYKVTVTGVINKDGSASEPTIKSKYIAVSVKPNDTSGNHENKTEIDIRFDKTIPADKVTADEIKEIAKAITTAVKDGDDSLKGDAGKAILRKVEFNTKANASIPENVKSDVAKSVDKAKASADTKAKETVASVSKAEDKSAGKSKNKSTDKSDNKPASKSAESKSAPNVIEDKPVPQPSKRDEAPDNSSADKPTYKSADRPAPKTSVPNKPVTQPKPKTWIPEKGHWEKVTTKVWVPHIITVTDKQAYDEKVMIGAYAQFADGYKAYTKKEYEEHATYCIRHHIADNYYGVPIYKTVHHNAVTHTEDHGHYETKITGKRWVVDEAGHYE